MATENTTTTNEKKVTVSQLKKSLTRSKYASDKAIATAVSGISGGETATDAERHLKALEAGAEECALLPAREEHALLLELLCRHGHGTAVGR